MLPPNGDHPKRAVAQIFNWVTASMYLSVFFNHYQAFKCVHNSVFLHILSFSVQLWLVTAQGWTRCWVSFQGHKTGFALLHLCIISEPGWVAWWCFQGNTNHEDVTGLTAMPIAPGGVKTHWPANWENWSSDVSVRGRVIWFFTLIKGSIHTLAVGSLFVPTKSLLQINSCFHSQPYSWVSSCIFINVQSPTLSRH